MRSVSFPYDEGTGRIDGKCAEFCMNGVQAFDKGTKGAYNKSMKHSLAVVIYGYAYYVVA